MTDIASIETQIDERIPVYELTDRQLLEEIAQNMRTCYDVFTAINQAVHENSMLRKFLGV